ncbi:uncharacterized protein LOC135690289 isoform X1 [Rhopilema esculentum]|uniref:uncharacterized protein LOC135690289 isoform X1 n=1 Tax=Rhopilema esculentum TaxID=499914 RepID=UPI0031D64196
MFLMKTLTLLTAFCMTIGNEHSLHHLGGYERDPIVISEQADRRSGIVKRAIMIGNKVCGNGIIKNKDGSLGEKRETIDLNSFHKDLHPERLKDEVNKPNRVIEDQNNGPAVVVSKQSKKDGWFERLNRCCIDHENCDRSIPAKKEQYGFKNEREYTVYDCKCDDAFAECLKYADSHTADAVGDLYFNVLKMPCINFEKGSNSTSNEDQSVIEKVDRLIAQRLKEKEGDSRKEKSIDKAS